MIALIILTQEDVVQPRLTGLMLQMKTVIIKRDID